MSSPTNTTSSSSTLPSYSSLHDRLIVDWDGDARSSHQLKARSNNEKNHRRRRSRRQVVGFCETTQITEIDGLSQKSDEEIVSAFYSEEDRQRFKKDIRSTVKRMRKGCMDNNAKYTERGLEHFASNDMFHQLRGERETLVDLILEAQERGLSHDEIAKISSRVSRRAVKRAQRKALADEAEAQEQYM